MHLFLTGAPGAGKSTALARTLALLEVIPGGFVTYYGAGRQRLYLGPAWAPRLETPEREVACMDGGRPVPDPAAFDRLGPAAILGCPQAPVLLFDECGNLEREAWAFQGAVLAALDGDRPILGVVKPRRAGTWLAALAAHPRVQILPVTPENRDALPAQLAGAMGR